MVHNCAILTCPLHNRRNIRKGLLFHSFPVDQHRFELWRQAVIHHCSRTLSINKHSKICHRHFRPDDYIANHTGLTRYLKATATPSVFNENSTIPVCHHLSSLTIDFPRDPLMNASKSPLTSSTSLILSGSSTTTDFKAKRLLNTIDKLHQIQNATKNIMLPDVQSEQDPNNIPVEKTSKSQSNHENSSVIRSTPLDQETVEFPRSIPQLVANVLPKNELEEALYKFLQQANLLPYFSAFIEQGGDDLKQLIEAENDDFQEIITLVGMKTKPLHVKRFKKALDDYRQDMNNKIQRETLSSPAHLKLTSRRLSTGTTSPDRSSSITTKLTNNPIKIENLRSSSPWRFHVRTESAMIKFDPLKTVNVHQSIDDNQRKLIADEAERLTNLLPPSSSMKKISGTNYFSGNMNLPRDFEDRWQRIRKFAAIYNNPFDSKKSDRMMTLHEVLINEAAASICFYRPEFLTRRDELLQLARRVLHNVGLSNLSTAQKRTSNVLPCDHSTNKYLKFDESLVKSPIRQRDSDAFRLMWHNREAKLAQIPIETEALRCEQTKLLQRLKQNTIDPSLSIDNTELKKQIDDLGKKIEQLSDEEKNLRRLIRKRNIRLRAKERQQEKQLTTNLNSTLDNFIMPILPMTSSTGVTQCDQNQQRSSSSFMRSTEDNDEMISNVNIKNEKIEPTISLHLTTESKKDEDISLFPSPSKPIEQRRDEMNEKSVVFNPSTSLMTRKSVAMTIFSSTSLTDFVDIDRNHRLNTNYSTEMKDILSLDYRRDDH